MRRVVFFFESVYPDNNACSVRAHFLISAFVKAVKDVELIVLTGTRVPVNMEGVIFLSLVVPKSYKSSSFIYRALKEFFLGVKAVIAFSKLKRDCDFIYISSPSYLASMFLTTFSYISKVRFVFEIRDIYPQAFGYAGMITEGGFFYKIFAFLSNLAYRKSVLNIAATVGIAQLINQNVSVSNNLVSFNGFPSSLVELTNKKKYDRFTLVFHGTLGMFQDIELLCRLGNELSVYNDIDLVVIGHGTKADLVEHSTKQNPNIRFLRSLNHKETMDIVAKCHVGLSLRFSDPLSFISFPVKNWEYLGLQIPSIICPFGSEAGRFLELNGCGIQVNTGDMNAIVDAVLRLKSDKLYYQCYVDNCARIRGGFTREALSSALVGSLIKDFFNSDFNKDC